MKPDRGLMLTRFVVLEMPAQVGGAQLHANLSQKSDCVKLSVNGNYANSREKILRAGLLRQRHLRQHVGSSAHRLLSAGKSVNLPLIVNFSQFVAGLTPIIST